MKELSIEEKAKAYDEAIEKAKKELDACGTLDCDAAKQIYRLFPELKESGGEEIRKELTDMLRDCANNIEHRFTSSDCKRWLDWFEKQGEQETLCDKCRKEHPSHSCQDITALGRCAVEHEQKTTDKVEPKFKIEKGKWYVGIKTLALRGKLLIIENNIYYARENGAVIGENESLFIDKHDGNASEFLKLWTIQDAKDGDVLVASDGSIFLFKCTIGCACKHYVALTTDDVVKFNEGLEHFWETSRAAHPATKEQRDTLFAKMKEAGYTFDFEKKELKKIENKNLLLSDFFKAEYERGKADAQKSAWSEDDEDILKQCLYFFNGGKGGISDNRRDEILNWFKSIKDRVQSQSRQGWSEEDTRLLDNCISLIEDIDCTKEEQNWLKSLKDRVLVQPEQDWSENDELILSNIIKDLVHPWNEYIPDRIEDEIKWLKNKLKSLRSQNRWNPSDEQVKALTHLFDGHLVGAKLIPKDYDNLKLLLEQLKKLRKE